MSLLVEWSLVAGERRMPAYALLLCSIASVLGTLGVTPLPPDIRLVAAGGCMVLAVYAASARCSTRRLSALLLAILAAAAFNAAWREHAVAAVVEHRTARYAGTILGVLNADDDSKALLVALDGGLRVLARVRGAAPPTGTRVVVRGRLEPFDDARNPDEPSDRAIEQERGIDAHLDDAAILAAAAGPRWDARVWLARAHEWAHEQLADRLGEPAASLVAGELWGERSALPPELRSEFQETGTVHVLVTAGLHLGVVAALCLAVFSLFAWPRWLACCAAIALLWTFVWWSGAELPAVRAASMATAALGARAFGRATLSWNALAIAALVVAIARPESVATPRSLCRSRAWARFSLARRSWSDGSRRPSHCHIACAKRWCFRLPRNSERGR